MRTLFGLAGLATLLAGVSLMVGNGMAGDGRGGREDSGKGLLRHVVLFRFTADTPQDRLTEVETAFSRLPDQIPTIRAFEWGVNNSPEGLNEGFTHCFLVTFDDEEGRDAYLPHPAHKQFVELLKPYLDRALVVDYVSR